MDEDLIDADIASADKAQAAAANVSWTPDDTSLRLSALDFAVRVSQFPDADRTVQAAQKFYDFLTARSSK